MAVLPGVALDELWQVVGVGENALLALSALVAVVSLAGLVPSCWPASTSAAANSPCCARSAPGRATCLRCWRCEGALVTLLGVAIGVLLAAVGIAAARPWLQIAVRARRCICPRPDADEWALLGACSSPACWPACCRAAAPTACRWPTAFHRGSEHDWPFRVSFLLAVVVAGSCAGGDRRRQAHVADRSARRQACRRRATPRQPRVDHLGRPDAQGLGPAEGARRHELGAARRRRSAGDRDARRMRETGNNAPTNAAIDGARSASPASSCRSTRARPA